MLKNLKKLREERGVSQKHLAEAVMVSQQSINKYENHDIEPDIATLIRLADYFETSVDYIIGYTDIRRRIEPIKNYDLNGDESAIIDGYRSLSTSERLSIRLVIENYINNSR